jgi:hypothetical protein
MSAHVMQEVPRASIGSSYRTWRVQGCVDAKLVLEEPSARPAACVHRAQFDYFMVLPGARRMAARFLSMAAQRSWERITLAHFLMRSCGTPLA